MSECVGQASIEHINYETMRHEPCLQLLMHFNSSTNRNTEAGREAPLFNEEQFPMKDVTRSLENRVTQRKLHILQNREKRGLVQPQQHLDISSCLHIILNFTETGY